MAYCRDHPAVSNDQLAIYKEQFGDGQRLETGPLPLPGNSDALEVWAMVKDQLIVNGDAIAIRLEAIKAVCEIMEFCGEKAIEIIKKIQHVKGVLYPVSREKHG
jgi:hypothetical protein